MNYTPGDIYIAIRQMCVDTLFTEVIDVPPNVEWSTPFKSAVIESLLLRIPLNNIVIRSVYSSDDTAKRSLVDGGKRLATIKQFLAGQFQLEGLELIPDLNKCTFTMLSPRYQRRLLETPITTYIIDRGCSPEVLQIICDRLKQ